MANDEAKRRLEALEKEKKELESIVFSEEEKQRQKQVAISRISAMRSCSGVTFGDYLNACGYNPAVIIEGRGTNYSVTYPALMQAWETRKATENIRDVGGSLQEDIRLVVDLLQEALSTKKLSPQRHRRNMRRSLRQKFYRT